MKSSETGGESNEFESVVSNNVAPAQTSPNNITVSHNDGRFQELKLPAPPPRSYIAISPPFLPSYQIAVTPVPSPQQVPQRPKATKTPRPPCHHARYVLEEKPKRSPTTSENMECTNCGTKNTSAWRRSAEGKSECNACNLFFRKNGRKRPASMRRDTIARRYRLSRCDLCALESQGGSQGNVGQAQKGPRSRRNGKPKALGPASDNSTTGPLCAPGPQGATQQQYFLANGGFHQPLQPFLPTNVSYVHQNPVMMSYSTERTVFNVMNVEHQLGTAPADPHLCFVRGAQNVVSPAATRALSTTEPLEVAEQEGTSEKFQVIEENIEAPRRNQDQYEQFKQSTHRQEYTDYAAIIKREHIDEQSRNELNETFTGIKQEDNVDDYASTPTAKSLLQDDSVSDSMSRHEIGGSFEVFEEKCRQEENELVFRSL